MRDVFTLPFPGGERSEPRFLARVSIRNDHARAKPCGRALALKGSQTVRLRHTSSRLLMRSLMSEFGSKSGFFDWRGFML